MFNPIDKLDPSNESKLDPIDKLVEYIQANQDLNAVLLIKRPWYYRFFSGVDGHAVNIFQYAGTTHYMDAQKKIYPSISAEAKKMKSELTSLIGSFHGSLEIGNVGF
ncbi:hypothetical protein [Candidatus Regiella endosymbiont of Tuberolachnus salignus]|uniref:hypothetical protein n=1 Tax=Candidatus Regiella endosymbiont of Tuberolachnus salignus TaxID=3077956 RepID=UPI0030D169B8